MTENIKNIVEGLGEDEFLLPVGYKDKDGVVHRVVTLTPLTGETEEDMADAKVRDNGGKVITTLLAGVIEKLGSLPRVTKDVIRDLTTMDRDFLIIKNRIVSIGENLDFTAICTCGAKSDVHVDLTKIEVKYLEREEDRTLTFDLPHGYKDRDGVIHKEITITLPTGRVQERVAPQVRSNPVIATTLMLQLITQKLGTLDFINPDVFRKMTKKDRDFISKKIAELEVGVDFDVNVICSDCGTEFTTSIPLQSLLGE